MVNQRKDRKVSSEATAMAFAKAAVSAASKRHHISYEELDQYHRPKQLDLAKFKDLNFGDKIVMQDGQLVGVYTKSLTAFESGDEDLYTKENCQKFIERDPRLFFYQSGGPDNIETKIKIFGTRKVVSESGAVIEQGLINGFEEPAWINFPVNAKIVNADMDSSCEY